MKKTTRYTAIMVLLVVGIVAALVVGGCARAPAEKEPIRIGFAFPYTGPFAKLGEDSTDWAMMGIEQINAEGGILGRPLEYVKADIKAGDIDPPYLLSTMEGLIGKKPHFIYGIAVGWTGVEADIIAESGIPYLCADPSWEMYKKMKANPEKYRNVFRVGQEQSMALAFLDCLEGVTEQETWVPREKTYAFIRFEIVYAKNLAEAMEPRLSEMGWTKVLDEMATAGTTEWGSLLLKIRRENPDLIINFDFLPPDQITFFDQFLEDPTDSVYFGYYAPTTPEFIDTLGDGANGVLTTVIQATIPDDRGMAKLNEYRSKYGKTPDRYAAIFYDSLFWYRDAVIRAGDPDDLAEVSKCLKNSTYRGILGTYNFQRPDDPEVNTVVAYPSYTDDPMKGLLTPIMQIRNQDYVLVHPELWGEGEFEIPPWME